MRVRRALLYTPGTELRKIQKATSLQVDSVCLDLEDGVAQNRKGEAREIVAHALRTLEFGRTERLVRINAIGSGLEEDDLAAILPAHPDGVVVPKVANAAQLHWVSTQIAAAEAEQEWPQGSIYLIAMIESARGVVNLPEIADADPRLEALVFGAEDFAADIGAVRTREGWEVLYARSAVVTVAAAFSLQAIDLLFLDFGDTEGLRAEAAQGAHMGFSGKQVIHPNQVIPVQEAFTPDDAAIREAQHVVRMAAEHQTKGAGAFALDGKMVDMPVVKSAERILARARAAGLVD